jgi:hypothetical protein
MTPAPTGTSIFTSKIIYALSVLQNSDTEFSQIAFPSQRNACELVCTHFELLRAESECLTFAIVNFPLEHRLYNKLNVTMKLWYAVTRFFLAVAPVLNFFFLSASFWSVL